MIWLACYINYMGRVTRITGYGIPYGDCLAGTSRPGWAWHSCISLGSLGSGRSGRSRIAWYSLGAGGPGGYGWSYITLWSHGTGRSRRAHLSRASSGTHGTSRPGGASRASVLAAVRTGPGRTASGIRTGRPAAVVYGDIIVSIRGSLGIRY